MKRKIFLKTGKGDIKMKKDKARRENEQILYEQQRKAREKISAKHLVLIEIQ